MVADVATIIATIGGVVLIGGLIYAAFVGNGDREREEAELARRRAEWQPRRTDYNAGALWKYAQLVGPAHLGAVTHPGGAAETHCYADQ